MIGCVLELIILIVTISSNKSKSHINSEKPDICNISLGKNIKEFKMNPITTLTADIKLE